MDMDPDSFGQSGLTLEEALKKYSDPEQYAAAEAAKMKAFYLREAGYASEAALATWQWRRLRKPLEAAFRKMFDDELLVACGEEVLYESFEAIGMSDASIDYERGEISGFPNFYRNVRVFEAAPVELDAKHSENPTPAFAHEAGYRHVTMDSQTYQLGQKQAKIVEALHQAALAGNPWCDGKRLLTVADAASMHISDLFKRNMNLIESDGRGLYRLRLTQST